MSLEKHQRNALPVDGRIAKTEARAQHLQPQRFI